MSPNDDARIFLADPPPPRTKRLSAAEVAAAVEQLRIAATIATQRGPLLDRYVPGLSIAVVFRDGSGSRVMHCEGYGLKHINRSDKPDQNTRFPCASLSKPVSASLVSRTNLDWNAPVRQRNEQYYRLAHAPSAATLGQWLSHTSGLPDHAGDLIEDMHPKMSRDEICQRIMQYQTGLRPGEYNYTNFGFTMGCLGAIHLAPLTWEEFTTNMLNSLEMKQSTYVFTSAFSQSAGNRVFPHRGGPARPEGTGGWAWNVVRPEDERDPTRQAPAGGLLSTANDMALFIKAHLDGHFGPTYPPQHPGVKSDTFTAYSLGWNVTDYSDMDHKYDNAINWSSFSHSGAFVLGASTCLRIDKQAGIGIAILTNGEPAGIPEVLVRLFFNQLYSQPGRSAFELPDGKLDYAKVFDIYREVFLAFLNAKANENSREYPPHPTPPIPDSVPQGEVFRGHSDFYACDIVVERKGDEVWLRMGDDWSFRLRYYDGGPDKPRFVYETIGENAVGASALTLYSGVDRRFDTLIDHWLDQDPPGKDSGSGVGVIQAR